MGIVNTFRITKEGIAGVVYDMDVIVKDTKVVVKYYINGEYDKSAIVPTQIHPLPSNNFEVFTSENTETITDQKLIDLVDSIKFKVGKCYSMSELYYDRLKRHGYDPVTYEGWVFLAYSPKAIHHCVVKVGNSIIDTGINDALEDEYRGILNERKITDADEGRKVMIELTEKYQNCKNSDVNPHIGKLSSSMIFVGVPNSPENAKRNYNILMDKYPDHEDYNDVGMTRYGNRLNMMMQERGLE